MTDSIQTAEAEYLKALEDAATSKPEAVAMRKQAQDLLKAADELDGPDIRAARQKLQQFRQMHPQIRRPGSGTGA